MKMWPFLNSHLALSGNTVNASATEFCVSLLDLVSLWNCGKMSTLKDGGDVGRLPRIKRRLEGWREVVIRADSVLGWEEDWYPAVITGVLTALFLFIWYWDPTLLTFFAIFGLQVAIVDFLVPRINNQVFGADSWNNAKEKKYGEVCEEILAAVDGVETAFRFCQDARGRKPYVHFFATLATLATLALLGNQVNNFLLAYLSTVALVMLPGLHRRGLLHKHFSKLSLGMADMIKGKESFKKSE